MAAEWTDEIRNDMVDMYLEIMEGKDGTASAGAINEILDQKYIKSNFYFKSVSTYVFPFDLYLFRYQKKKRIVYVPIIFVYYVRTFEFVNAVYINYICNNYDGRIYESQNGSKRSYRYAYGSFCFSKFNFL